MTKKGFLTGAIGFIPPKGRDPFQPIPQPERTQSSSDMVQGFIDGSRPDAVPPGPNHSASYRHGWQNGKDDKMGKPRAKASKLREMAKEAIRIDEAR